MERIEVNLGTGEIEVIELTPEEIAEANRSEQEYLSSLTYAQKRVAEYPDFRDYLDGIVKGDQEQIAAYINACLAVKAKYPKG